MRGGQKRNRLTGRGVVVTACVIRLAFIPPQISTKNTSQKESLRYVNSASLPLKVIVWTYPQKRHHKQSVMSRPERLEICHWAFSLLDGSQTKGTALPGTSVQWIFLILNIKAGVVKVLWQAGYLGYTVCPALWTHKKHLRLTLQVWNMSSHSKPWFLVLYWQEVIQYMRWAQAVNLQLQEAAS